MDERQKQKDTRAREEARRKRLAEKRRRRRNRRIRRIVLGVLAGCLALALCVVGGRWAYRTISRWISPAPGQPSAVRAEYCPVVYEDWIRAYAEENDLEPAYVAAVILAESSYRPDAVSSVGARGLMQLMEETAGDVAGWLGEEFDWDAMFDPETNIRYGCCLLGRLMRRYDGDMRCASSAYHQGMGTVDRWLSDPNYSEDGKTLAVIASSVTNNYVEKILRYYERYTEIYAEEEQL